MKYNVNKAMYLYLELLGVFGLVPLIYSLGLIPLPKIPVLLAAFTGCLFYLYKTPGYNRSELIDGLDRNSGELRWILIRSCGVAVVSVVAVLIIDPELLFGFPRARPRLWLLVMVLYPLLSAYPQEVIYRAFFFQRYKPILSSPVVMVWVSTLAFSFLHIVFHNWLAVFLTIPAGYVFTRTYLRTKSLLMAALEHALYGCIIFTSGLGRFFYNP